MLNVENLSFRTNQRTLLTQLSFEARAGELLAIVGPNGAGKSTLLKLCAGEQKPTAGTIALHATPLSAYSSKQLAQCRGMLHQQNTLAFPVRVHELVLMGRYPHYGAHPSPADYSIAAAALETVGMQSFNNRIVSTLSGGEQQRVQLARVLAQVWTIPNGLLLLDEPTTGLDLLHQHQLLDVARQMAQRGFAVVAVLHDLNMAAQYADQILMLRAGRLEAYGTPNDVLTASLVERVFGLPVKRLENPCHHCPLIVPVPTFSPAFTQ
ncbi:MULTISPECIES: heme ABC transporter ATP-binding protein [Spirosoma]|uniref:Heme ABC transporter ATP-binding protein n=1 Tax=Spirosoma sordidisoli TaxID=2502893 RepID=A0A4Q2UIB3_9BACT|nr:MULTISPECIES: heme ABC transporter ATP-binding protein [Spirosoma]RYC67090.1 heme ABC transporter ATP-binding protein [Spirosoma sordidisoli]